MTRTLKEPFDPVNFKYAFPGVELICDNYSQASQDLFVLSMLDGRRNGTWLEIGCGWPLYISNTALLEFDFDWSGVSIDTTQEVLNEWIGTRNNTTTHANALFVDFVKLFEDHGITKTDIDYLSLDCDPPAQTYEILLRIPFDQYRFAVITFEHDSDLTIQRNAHTYLAQHGYKLVVRNISDRGIANPYEDWYVHPGLVDTTKIAKHLADDDSPKDYLKYFYQNIRMEYFGNTRILHKIFHQHSVALNICMENASLTLADMASLKNLIEAATARGAFRANEMSTVGGIYDKLDAFLTATQAQLAQQAEAQQPAEPTQGE